jgi:putative ATP-grasp target RiPP
VDSSSDPIPWGLTRMTARLPLPTPAGRAVLAPDTQTTVFFDETGQPIEMGKHGTNTTTSTTTKSGGGDGKNPQQEVADDSTPDYVSD